jgi:hypothetical protein
MFDTVGCCKDAVFIEDYGSTDVTEGLISLGPEL